MSVAAVEAANPRAAQPQIHSAEPAATGMSAHVSNVFIFACVEVRAFKYKQVHVRIHARVRAYVFCLCVHKFLKRPPPPRCPQGLCRSPGGGGFWPFFGFSRRVENFFTQTPYQGEENIPLVGGWGAPLS